MIVRLGLLLLLVFSGTSAAKTSLWEVSNGERMLYLGGTIHMLSETDYPLPGEFNAAYKSADRLVFETDLRQLTEPRFQQMLLQRVALPVGQTLANTIKPSTHRAVDAFLRSRGQSIVAFERLKPSMVSISLSVMEMRRLGLTSIGVDQHFFQRAAKDGKPTDELESAEEQIHFVANMGAENPDALLLNTLRDLRNLREMLDKIKTSWRGGDSEALARVALDPMRSDYPDLYQTLMVNRNNNWLPQILGMMETGETELVLVGALHLVGEHGLLQQLRARGFSVRRVES
ncbi:MAG: TraB/GumN family protein [Pseudomonadota bacterium]